MDPDWPLDMEPVLEDWANAAPVPRASTAAIAANLTGRVMRVLLCEPWNPARGISRSGKFGTAPARCAGNAGLDARIPFVSTIFPIAPVAARDIAEAVGNLDPLQIFRLLVAKLPFDPQA
jgi:hypothetical protein